MVSVQDLGGIYIVVNTVNGKVYVGKTKDKLRIRWQQHVALARRGSNFPFHCAIRKYGAEAFQFCLLSSFPLQPDSEAYYIAKYRAAEPKYGYNIAPGGDFPTRLWTEKQRKAQSEKFKKNNPMQDASCKEKMVKSLTGRHLSSSHRRAIGEFQKLNNPSKRSSVKTLRSEQLRQHNPGQLFANRLASSKRLKARIQQPGYIHPMTKLENVEAARERVRGKIWVHREDEKKHIDPVQKEEFLQQGWTLGLGPRKNYRAID